MSPTVEGSAKRTVDLDYDTTARRMSIVYDPDNTGGGLARFEVQPWEGAHEFLVDESLAAGCSKWIVRVRVEWRAEAALGGEAEPLRISYELEDYDVRDLMGTDDA